VFVAPIVQAQTCASHYAACIALLRRQALTNPVLQ